MTSVDRRRAPRKGAAVPSFTPKHVHRAYGMEIPWASALERTRRPDGRRLPGSARRVLEILRGAAALNLGPASQLGIVRLSHGEIPRATVQDGLRALEECGLVVRSSKGWSLKVQAPEAKKAPCRISAPDKGEVPSPVNPSKAPCGERAARKPSNAALWAKAMVAAGWSKSGAWSTARKIQQDFLQGAVEAAHELAKQGKGKDPKGLASWILTEEWKRVVVYLKKPRRKLAKENQVENQVADPMVAVREILAQLQNLRARKVDPDAPGFLEHLDELRRLERRAVSLAEGALGESLPARRKVEASLQASGLKPGDRVWDLALDRAWGRAVMEAAGLWL